MNLRIDYNKFKKTTKIWIFVGYFECQNFDSGRWGFRFAINDFVNSQVPYFIQFKLLSVLCTIIFGLAVLLAPGALRPPPPPNIRV